MLSEGLLTLLENFANEKRGVSTIEALRCHFPASEASRLGSEKGA